MITPNSKNVKVIRILEECSDCLNILLVKFFISLLMCRTKVCGSLRI